MEINATCLMFRNLKEKVRRVIISCVLAFERLLKFIIGEFVSKCYCNKKSQRSSPTGLDMVRTKIYETLENAEMFCIYILIFCKKTIIRRKINTRNMERWLENISLSPWYKLVGMRPRFKDGEIIVELYLEEKHHQALGVAHGGVLASVLDSAIALNINKELIKIGKIAVTAQLNIHYLKSVLKGKIVGIGRPLYIGNKTAVGYGEATIDDDLVATATALLVIR